MYLGKTRLWMASIVVLIGLVFVLFWLWPQLDFMVSDLFFLPGRGFGFEKSPGLNLMRAALWNSSLLVLCFAIAMWATALLRGKPMLNLWARGWAYVVTLFLLGPGVLVNLILKAHWGRARPFQVAEFGGTARFTPPHQYTDQCLGNCSFVSGEVAGATAMAIGLLVILYANRASIMRPVFAVCVLMSVCLPLFSAFQRVTTGRHFLSDAVLAILFVILLGLLLAPIFRGKSHG
jgi:lipid A 4'-phosphatase